MEHYIKRNVSDITYKSELTPHPEIILNKLSGCGVQFAHITYVGFHLPKLCAH